MPLDHFIYFDQKIPSKEDLEKVLEDYIGESGFVHWETDRWFIDLIGKSSFPFRRISGYEKMGEALNRNRWLEVYFSIEPNCYVNVMTRSQDEFTNVVAKGLANLVKRFWGGRLE